MSNTAVSLGRRSGEREAARLKSKKKKKTCENECDVVPSKRPREVSECVSVNRRDATAP